MSILVSAHVIDTAVCLQAFRQRQSVRCGAMVDFSGLMRQDEQGCPVALWLEHYPSMTERMLNEHMEQAKECFGLLDVEVRHRIGRIEAAEVIVWVATAAAHRRAAFEGCMYLMDYLKTEAPFWKRNIGPAGPEDWVGARTFDAEQRRRWERQFSMPGAPFDAY